MGGGHRRSRGNNNAHHQHRHPESSSTSVSRNSSAETKATLDFNIVLQEVEGGDLICSLENNLKRGKGRVLKCFGEDKEYDDGREDDYDAHLAKKITIWNKNSKINITIIICFRKG